MAQELSSNWKKLQAKIQAESSTAPISPPEGSTSQDSSSSKKRKSRQFPEKGPTPKKPKSNNASHRVHISPISKALPQKSKSSTKPQAMGVTQSSAIVKGTPATVTPSLALWAKENDITAEDLAEAYNLGSKRGRTSSSAAVSITEIAQDKRRVNEGLAPNVEVGKYIAIDCEMVGIGPEGHDHMLARVSCVDFHGKQVYDSFVCPRERVTDYRTEITGITASMLRSSSARPFEEVQATVSDLLRGRILIGHDVRHDLAVLEISHPTPQIRDTARHSSFRKYGHGPKPALRVLAREILGLDEFQKGKHSSIEDARVAMLLFRTKKSEFDVENGNRYGMDGGLTHNLKSKGPKASKSKRKKR
ncbi:ribonuclease H-like domain-containing protein [Xylaria bambusicola]|uniref:ribonuclease H-like domain-containing protein n=1 Tax=Xylaria bambusicola TaxID=326684 RepID=UPI002008DDD6|nr:ribonuclease H-like domain-containing protein [Xylaria bambusicola]KAI0505293.1 ribonuclease H-like domain-containing protein [Xylaria bambusicola]